MKTVTIFFLLNFILVFTLSGQTNNQNLLSDSDLAFLKDMTKDVMESSRIYPGQNISDEFGRNNTGGILIRPGGRSCYPAFWIRDYAMSLESGFVTNEEQMHMLLLTASKQCDQTWITKAGSIIPLGAIADHIRIDDSKPIFYPGTFSYSGQGGKTWGMVPPYGDQYFFIHMAHYYLKSTSTTKVLLDEINGVRLIDRLETAFKVPPTQQDGVLVYTTDDFRGVDFGFRDVINITGNLCLPSLFKYRASLELAELFDLINRKDKADFYRAIALRLKNEIPEVFSDSRGMLVASTGKSQQSDVWSTALAVYFGVLEGEEMNKTCQFLTDTYKNGTLAYRGNIRHVLTCDDFNDSSAWEYSLAKKNTYQNGAYWGTPTGWVCYAIAKVDDEQARKLASEYIEDLRTNDYRKGGGFEAPVECFHPSGNKQNPVYLTTVTCPFAVFSLMKK
ncbi:MAG: hypothetical protein HQ522_00215 [Bacteroidetes bacterium]|nr:hypothetical protein [Bacteroidota bacterium]